MKLAPDALLAIIDALRKGLTDNCDISELLTGLDLEPNADGKLGLTTPLKDVWGE